MFGRQSGQFALVEIGLVIDSTTLELFGPHRDHLQVGLFREMFGFRDGAGGRRRFSAAVFVYFAQRVHKLFAFGFGRDRRRRRRLRGWILRRTGFRRRRRPDGRQQFLRPGVKLFGRILRRLWRNGPPEELFLLLEALFYPGHDD